jgi:hypothetical protein
MHNVREKICALSGLPLPYDMIHEICGYNFYDKETCIVRDKKREIMKTVLREANTGCSSNKIGLKKYDDVGTWWFLHNDKNNGRSLSLLCDFCVDCGNYISVNRGYIDFSVKCICADEDDYYSYEDAVREFKEDYWLFGY